MQKNNYNDILKKTKGTKIMTGKLIVIEGTDCSGKETQSRALVENLNKMGIKAIRMAFPNYDSPTGKIIGGAFLGKENIDIPPVFPETAVNVPAKVASLFYAADRCYNVDKIQNYLNQGYTVVLDRYVESNMAFQGCKINDKEERLEFYNFINTLEYSLLNIPKPDLKILLYMPTFASAVLKKGRSETPDQNEKDEKYLQRAENTYLEIANLYNFKIISCTEGQQIKTIEQIQQSLKSYVVEFLDNCLRLQ